MAFARELEGYFVSPHDNPPKWMAMITAYLDESGHEAKNWMFVAGFFGNDEQWNALVPLWTDALGRQRKHLHMNSLRWASTGTRNLLSRLGPIPYKCNLQPTLAGVRVGDYEDLITGTPAQRLLKGYLVCIIPLVIQLLRVIPGNERLEIVFEQQKEYEPYAHLALAALTDMRVFQQDFMRTDTGLPKLAKWSFVPKNSTSLTEPADYIAFALRHLWQDKDSKKTQWCRPILDPSGGTAIGAILRREQIREVMILTPFRAFEIGMQKQVWEIEDAKRKEER
jgi:hypothetical protein